MGMEPVQDTSHRFLPLVDRRVFAPRSNQPPPILPGHRNPLGCDPCFAGPIPLEVEMPQVPKAVRRQNKEMAASPPAVRKLRAPEVLGRS
jgi:hypothetical protein